MKLVHTEDRDNFKIVKMPTFFSRNVVTQRWLHHRNILNIVFILKQLNIFRLHFLEDYFTRMKGEKRTTNSYKKPVHIHIDAGSIMKWVHTVNFCACKLRIKTMTVFKATKFLSAVLARPLLSVRRYVNSHWTQIRFVATFLICV